MQYNRKKFTMHKVFGLLVLMYIAYFLYLSAYIIVITILFTNVILHRSLGVVCPNETSSARGVCVCVRVWEEGFAFVVLQFGNSLCVFFFPSGGGGAFFFKLKFSRKSLSFYVRASVCESLSFYVRP